MKNEYDKALDAIHDDLIKYHNGYDGQTESRINTIRKALTIARGNQWQPISTAPKDGTEILVLWLDGKAISNTRMMKSPDGLVWDAGIRDPSHWQPLPAPPKESSE